MLTYSLKDKDRMFNLILWETAKKVRLEDEKLMLYKHSFMYDKLDPKLVLFYKVLHHFGFTQEDIRKKAGVSRNFMTNLYEENRRYINSDRLKKDMEVLIEKIQLL